MIRIREADELIVRVGDHDIENPNPALVELPIDFFILHEDYDSGSGGSDIALVKVNFFSVEMFCLCLFV